MKITGDFEATIIKMIKEETLKANDYDESQIVMYEPVEIYEVEEWDSNPFSYDVNGYSEYFTTLEEAIQHYEEVASFTIDSVEYDDINKNSLATYYNSGCTLRKIKIDLLDEHSKTLDIDIEQTIKEIVVTITKYN